MKAIALLHAFGWHVYDGLKKEEQSPLDPNAATAVLYCDDNVLICRVYRDQDTGKIRFLAEARKRYGDSRSAAKFEGEFPNMERRT